jgi:hypothetical protein
MRLVASVAAAAAWALATAPSAHAYIDPQSGSYVMQILIASLAAGGLAIATFWRRILRFVRRVFGKGKEQVDGYSAGVHDAASTPIVPAVEVGEPSSASGDEAISPKSNETPDQTA